MNRERLLTFLPASKHGNARWVYQRLEEHFLYVHDCNLCVRHDNTMHIRGNVISHIKAIAHDEMMDINGIILYLRKGLIRYLATKDGAIITFCEIEEKKGAIAS